MSPRLRAAVAAAALLLAAGCSTESKPLALAPSPATALGAPALRATASPAGWGDPLPHALRVSWLPLLDERIDPAAIGAVGVQSYVATEAPAWIEQALRELGGRGFQTVAADAEGELVVEPRLLKLYVQNVDVTKSAVVVLALTFERAGHASTRRIYRGRHTSMNWWSSAGELTGALQAALADALDQIRVDLEARARASTPM